MLKELQSRIDYYFDDERRLKQALTHSSYTNEHKKKVTDNNERMEFLGDAVLEIIISEFLFINYPLMKEGELSRLRASIVCEQMLAKKARKIKLGKYLVLGHGEDFSGGRDRESILADAFEAVIGAVFLDGGLESAKLFVLNTFVKDIKELQGKYKSIDYKSYLQELIQAQSKRPLVYEIISESGPDHNKVFEAMVIHDKNTLGTGKGKTKKEAEQNAALASINRLTDL